MGCMTGSPAGAPIDMTSKKAMTPEWKPKACIKTAGEVSGMNNTGQVKLSTRRVLAQRRQRTVFSCSSLCWLMGKSRCILAGGTLSSSASGSGSRPSNILTHLAGVMCLRFGNLALAMGCVSCAYLCWLAGDIWLILSGDIFSRSASGSAVSGGATGSVCNCFSRRHFGWGLLSHHNPIKRVIGINSINAQRASSDVVEPKVGGSAPVGNMPVTLKTTKRIKNARQARPQQKGSPRPEAARERRRKHRSQRHDLQSPPYSRCIRPSMLLLNKPAPMSISIPSGGCSIPIKTSIHITRLNTTVLNSSPW